MAKDKYYITKLKKISKLKAAERLRNTSDHQEYFDKLSDFVLKAPFYLQDYNPVAIINNDDVQKKFLTDLKKTQRSLAGVGIINIAEELNNLIDAIYKEDETMLGENLKLFHAEMSRMGRQVAEARVPKHGEVLLAGHTPSVGRDNQVIFVVDDSPMVLKIITDMLKDKYKVLSMAGGKIALKALETHLPVLFLIDIEMPVMNGYEVARQIRLKRKFKKTPILFLSSKSTLDSVLTAIAHGGNDYIIKPVDKEILLNKIEVHLAK